MHLLSLKTLFVIILDTVKSKRKRINIFSFSTQAARRVGLPADKTYKRRMNLCDISPILLFLKNKILVEINISLISRKNIADKFTKTKLQYNLQSMICMP